jgi:hypothetical protein
MFWGAQRATSFLSTTEAGAGAQGADPSVAGAEDGEESGGERAADPKRYGRNEWSSSPHTPWEPAGSRVYVIIRVLVSSKYGFRTPSTMFFGESSGRRWSLQRHARKARNDSS